MASRKTWAEAASLLRETYQRLASKDALAALYHQLDDLPDEVLSGAIGRHINDTTVEGTTVAGAWFPKPAQLRVHANKYSAEQLLIHKQELATKAADLKATFESTPTKTVDFPEEVLGKAEKGVKHLHLSPSSCGSCRDSGLANYYIPADRSHPAAKYRLYLEKDYLALPDDMQTGLVRFSAVCDCAAGQLKREQRPEGHTRTIKSAGGNRRMWIAIEEARRFAARRKEKEEAQNEL